MKINYDASIVNVSNALLNHYGLPPYHTPLKAVSDELAKDYDHVALLVLDGYGHNLYDLHEQESSFLKNHTIRTITSVYPSTTTAATTALLTGLTPYESGYFGWFQYLKDEDVHYTIFMQTDYYDKQKKINPAIHKRFERDDLFGRIERETGLKTKTIFPKKVDHVNGYDTLNDGLKTLSSFQKQHTKTLSYVYSVEPDLTQHLHGTHSSEVKHVLKSINDTLEAYQKTLPKNTLLIVTADHGLTNVKPINLFDYHDITATFETLPANEPRMTNFFIKPHMREHFIRFFEEHFNDFFDLYTKDEFLMKKLLGHGEKSPLIDNCIGDFIAVAKDQYFFKLSDDKEHKAHHAGGTDDEMIVPLIFISKDD